MRRLLLMILLAVPALGADDTCAPWRSPNSPEAEPKRCVSVSTFTNIATATTRERSVSIASEAARLQSILVSSTNCANCDITIKAERCDGAAIGALLAASSSNLYARTEIAGAFVVQDKNGNSTAGVQAGDFFTRDTGVYAFSSTTGSGGTPDSSLSRISAGLVGVGTGAAGEVDGWLAQAGRDRRTATQAVTDSAALTADNQLSISLLAGRSYRFRLEYYFTTVATSGVQVDLNGGSATMTALQGHGYMTNLGTYVSEGNLAGAELTALTSTVALTATGTNTMVVMEGALTVNAAGTFIPRFAQNAETGAAESVTAKVLSHLVMEDVP